MAEHFLNNSQVGAIGEEVGGKTMSQEMWIDIDFHTRAFGMFLYDLPNPSGGEFSAAGGKKNLTPRLGSNKVWPLRRNISRKRLGSCATHRHQSGLVAFADHAQDSFFVVELFQSRCGQLGNTQTTGVKQFDNGAIAQAEFRFDINGIE